MQIERKGAYVFRVCMCVWFMTWNYWGMFFVVRLNDSFNFSLGLIKYCYCAILTWRVCLWCVAECCDSSGRSASWFCACRHIWKVCKGIFLCFTFLTKRLTPLLSFDACCTCCVGHADFLYSPQALELLYISSYLFILYRVVLLADDVHVR